MAHAPRALVLVLLAILVLAEISGAVDRSKFKRCQDSGFCRRNRKLADTPNSKTGYTIVSGSLRLESPENLVADLSQPGTSGLLKLVINKYKNDILRIRVQEKTPLAPRFEADKFTLIDGVAPLPIDFDSATSTIRLGDNKRAVIQAAPLKIDLYVDNELVISTNDRGLFNFEQLRKKSELPAQPEGEDLLLKEASGEAKPEDEAGTEEATADDDDEEERVVKRSRGADAAPTGENDGHWDEHFGSHHDSKPLGPESLGLDFTFVGSTHVYGIPEHTTNLDLPSTKGPGVSSEPYRLYNLDVFEYELREPMALYGAVPLMISHRPGKTTAIFWLNGSETWIDVERTVGGSTQTHWFSESGIMDVFFLLGPTPDDVFTQYASLTGTQALPPLFSVAYHQCRWNYRDEVDVAKVDAGFDEYDIPYDVIWLDIEHTDGKKYFTWEKTNFPTPQNMLANIKSKGRKMVTIVDPHIKRDRGYDFFTDAEDKKLYVKKADGGDYEGWCWPGSSSWLDWFYPDAYNYYVDHYSYDKYIGSADNLFTWNDMNEPSVFNGPEVTMHKDAKHYGGWEHRDVHNVYGMLMQKATAEGLVKRNPGKNLRPFVLSRAIWAGTQRYGAIWTGDNTAAWDHLEYANPMLLTLNLAGISFSGADVGGFFKDPDAELMSRWYQAGTFYPFFRAHGHLDTKRREPWLFGEPYTSINRQAIRLRYALLPFWYTRFEEASRTGRPILRPLWVEYPNDAETFSMQDEFLVGRDLLVKPIVHAGVSTVQVYFPGNQPWYSLDDGAAITDAPCRKDISSPLSKGIPVYQRGGSIVPRKERARRSSSQMADDPYTLVVALDKQQRAEGELYIDDGATFDYLQGAAVRQQFTFANGALKSSPIVSSSSFVPKNRLERVVVLGLTKAPTKVVLVAKGQADSELEFAYDNTLRKLVVRKPWVGITDDWEIQLQ